MKLTDFIDNLLDYSYFRLNNVFVKLSIKEFSILVIVSILFIASIGIFIKRDEVFHFLFRPLSQKQSLITNIVEIKQKYNAFVVSQNAVDILPYINGFIDKVLVKEGQYVTTGTPLFIIQQRQYLVQKEIAETNVMAAQTALNLAQKRLNKLEQKTLEGNSSDNINMAKHDFLMAQKRLNKANMDLRRAQTNFDYTLVQSPTEGIVKGISISKGNYVSPAGQASMQILNQSQVRVVFKIDINEYHHIQKSNNEAWTFKLQLPNGEMYPYTGVLHKIVNQSTQNGADIFVYVDFHNSQGLLALNSTVRIIWERKAKSVQSVPDETIYSENMSLYVYSKL